MKDLKETLDAFSCFGGAWWRRLWMPYGVLAVVAGVFVALLLWSCESTFFPLMEWWRMTGDWTLAQEMVVADVTSTSLTGVAFVALFPASWLAHRAMARVVGGYGGRARRGRKRVLGVLTAASIMAVTLAVMWMPLVTLFLSADATALSVVWDDAVETPVWVWIEAFVAATMATFVSEWAMTLCRLMFRELPAAELADDLEMR